jgi:hypothetical protein
MPFDGIGRIRRVTSVPSTNMNRVFFRHGMAGGGAGRKMMRTMGGGRSRYIDVVLYK